MSPVSPSFWWVYGHFFEPETPVATASSAAASETVRALNISTSSTSTLIRFKDGSKKGDPTIWSIARN